jgi:transcriptional regulator with XRE-family HTH domain
MTEKERVMKRQYYKIETDVTRALKRIRNSKGVSLRRLGKMMGTSEGCINDRENGRVDDISEEYISHLVVTLGYTMDDWCDFLSGNVTTFDLKNQCISILEKLDRDKLKSIHLFLENFTK